MIYTPFDGKTLSNQSYILNKNSSNISRVKTWSVVDYLINGTSRFLTKNLISNTDGVDNL